MTNTMKVRAVSVYPDDDFAMSLAATATMTVRCCREWQVTPLMGWGRCGLCGQKPEVVL